MITRSKNKKSLFKKAVSFFVMICMIWGVMVPMMTVPSSAAAPASYTNITTNSSASVSISTSGGAKYFKFVPTQSGTYKFYSSNNTGDTRGALLNASGTELVNNDDSGGNLNFSFNYDCTANTTYYIKAYMYGSNTGSYTLHVQTLSVTNSPQTPVGDVLEIDAAGGTNYSLFNSGRTTSSGYEADCNGSNPAPATHNNSGYDLYGDLSSLPRFRLGLSFTVSVDISEQSVLNVRAWDVDESYAACGYGYEHDYIYLIDETTGTSTKLSTHLSGQDDTWNTSAITLSPDLFTMGHTYHFELQMTCSRSHNCSYYAITVRTVDLIVNGSVQPPVIPETGIENADLSASISSSGLVSVNLTANAYAAETYTLEYKAVCSSNDAQYGGKESGVTIPMTSTAFNTTFQLETGAPRGTYEITVFIKDAAGTVIATRTATASYGYSAVSYHSNGGSQNLPTDGTTYSSGNIVTVKFDYVPSLYGYVFLGWSTDRYATQPMYTENGANTFTIGANDVTLYAIWEVEACEHEWSETSRNDATCITDGFVVSTCLLCGEVEETAHPALGHDYVNGICSRCGAEEPAADIWDGSIATGFGGGSGTVSDPYLIYTGAQLAYLAQTTNAGTTYSGEYFKLMNNIDLNHIEWTPIGQGRNTTETYTSTLSFYGNFDGNYHTVANMKILNAQTTYTGLFGCLYGACVSNLGVVGTCIDITRNLNYRTTVGILAGATGENVRISSCYAIGTVSVNHTSNSYIIDVGGFVGDCYGATIENCYCVADVVAASNENQLIGVFCGYAENTVSLTNCFSYGSCAATGRGNAYIGGLNGGNQIYSAANVYYCSSTRDLIATALTENQLKNTESFVNWDFVNVWRMDTDYPVLRGFDNNGGGVLPPVHDHSFGEWVIDRAATCTENGSKHQACTSCGEIRTGYIPALGHDYESELTRAATCVLPGIMTYTCNNCGDSYIIYVYAEHHYEHTSRTDATCTEDGEDIYTCTICGDSYSIPIVGGHNYEAVIERVATATEDGLIRYTCSKCGDSYTETIPMRPDANVLLVQDRFPWSENNNVSLLTKMKADGYITDWSLTTTANFGSVDLSQYSVILIANDQTTATYNQLARLADSLYAFAAAGGTVIYGACDNGWAGGNISHSLPEGVEKDNYYSRHNYIVDTDHAIVTGVLTDGKSLTNQLLYGNYCSHTAFERSTLPVDANVILQDANGDATLVEYSVGNGHVILSGLTWEFYYTRGAYDYRLNTTYTKNVYDDLVVYALSLVNPCDHAYDEGTVVLPTCTENGYTLHTCASCGATMKDQIVPALGHTAGEWIVVLAPTTGAEGLKRKSCTVCGETLMEETLPMLDAPIIRVDAPSDSVILGQTLTFSVVIEDCRLLKSMALVPIFDTDIFELVDARWTIAATMQNVEAGTLRAVSAWSSLTDVNTTVFTITLRAKALTESTLVTFTALLQDNDGTVVASVVGKNVAVIECPHEHGTYTSIDDEYHAYVCDLCGEAQVMAHEYTNACDETCNACGHERVAPHVPSEVWSNNSETHWHVCEECGVQLHVAEHIYDDADDMICNVCDYRRYILGDVDNDGDRDSDDAVYLVSYLVFGEVTYPVYQPLDFDGNGTVDSNDAIYLLYNTFFGDAEYPLSRG